MTYLQSKLDSGGWKIIGKPGHMIQYPCVVAEDLIAWLLGLLRPLGSEQQKKGPSVS